MTAMYYSPRPSFQSTHPLQRSPTSSTNSDPPSPPIPPRSRHRKSPSVTISQYNDDTYSFTTTIHSHPAAEPVPSPRKRVFKRLIDATFGGGRYNPNGPGEKGLSALHRAVLNADTERVRFLLEDVKMNVDVHAQRRGVTGWKETVLYLAVVGGSTSVVSTLLDAGADVDETCLEDCARMSPLHRAAIDNKLDILRLLISRGVNVDVIDLKEKTPLHYAAEAGNTKAVEILLGNGAYIDRLAAYWIAPLYLAVQLGHTDVVEVLTSRGADVVRRSNEWKDNTLLHQALLAPQNRAACLELLLLAGAPPDTADKQGNTALHIASMRGQVDCVKMLLRYGCDVTLLTSPPTFVEEGKVVIKYTALELAYRARRQSPETIELLQSAVAFAAS